VNCISIAMCCFITRQCADRTRDPETRTCPRSIGPASRQLPTTDRLPGFLAQNEFVGHGDGSIGSWPKRTKSQMRGARRPVRPPGGSVAGPDYHVTSWLRPQREA
jgi:hypothetical protein